MANHSRHFFLGILGFGVPVAFGRVKEPITIPAAILAGLVLSPLVLS